MRVKAMDNKPVQQSIHLTLDKIRIFSCKASEQDFVKASFDSVSQCACVQFNKLWQRIYDNVLVVFIPRVASYIHKTVQKSSTSITIDGVFKSLTPKYN